MNHRVNFILLALGALLLAGCMTTSFEGDFVVPSGQTERGNLFVTSGTVTLQEDSRVTGSILMTSGDLRIGKNAQVGGDVVLTSGSVSMTEGSVLLGRSSKHKSKPSPTPAAGGTDDPHQKLKQLKAMLDEGVISEKDYEAKKSEILSKM